MTPECVEAPMASLFERDRSTVGTAVGLAVCLVAVLGSQFLGWEWGSGQLVPAVIGGAAVVAAGVLAYRRFRR